MLARLDRLLATASSLVTVVPVLAGSAVVSALLTWAAYATERLSPYAPFSWALAGTMGLLISALILLVLAKTRKIATEATIQRKFFEGGQRINPLNKQFNGERIAISDLVSPIGNAVVGKTFVECELIGPANIGLIATAPGRGEMSSCELIDAAGMVVRNNVHLPTLIMFKDCTLLRCKFYSIMFMVNDSMAQKMSQDMPNMVWVTHFPSLLSTQSE